MKKRLTYLLGSILCLAAAVYMAISLPKGGTAEFNELTIPPVFLVIATLILAIGGIGLFIAGVTKR